MQTPRITVLGSINMDLVVQCARLALPGETVLAESSREVPGGKGANQAVAAARLGASVALVGRVGDDAFAARLLDNLRHEGIDTSQVWPTENVASGLAVVAVEASGENSILVVPGANGCLTPDDVRQASGTIANSDILLLQLEVPLETVRAAIRVARQHGVRVVLDPAPAPAAFPDELFGADVLCPNQSEAAAILGQAVVAPDEALAAAAALVTRGAQWGIVTLGADGAALSDGQRQWRIPAYPVQVVDTTAAGDAFAAGLAVGWSELQDLARAVPFACAVGALAASRCGAQPGMPHRADVDRLLNQHT